MADHPEFHNLDDDGDGIVRQLADGLSTRIFPGDQAMISIVEASSASPPSLGLIMRSRLPAGSSNTPSSPEVTPEATTSPSTVTSTGPAAARWRRAMRP